MICPTVNPIYDRNVLTCESSLYFQRDEARTLCSRRIFPQIFAPIFIRHSHAWIYCFSGKQQVNLKCRRNATWITSTWPLQGSGILHNASACHVTGQDFQLYPATEGHSVNHRIPRWRTSTSRRTYHPPGGTDTSKTFTPRCIKAGRYNRNFGTV